MQITKAFILLFTAAVSVSAIPTPAPIAAEPKVNAIHLTRRKMDTAKAHDAISIILDKSCRAIPKCKAGRKEFMIELFDQLDALLHEYTPSSMEDVEDLHKYIVAQAKEIVEKAMVKVHVESPPGFVDTMASALANAMGGV
ncbi:hypothetical protein TWF694_003439 [Orbilia ellipsospora]|uniref:Uncharacterized protein n=1 Tax=Orbilia ellipsospora TaxID=2528407 RepID=A0AAV9X451_9PEZI